MLSIKNIFKKDKHKINSDEPDFKDEFDDKFGFMLKHNIVTKDSYLKVKKFYHYKSFQQEK